MIAPPEQVCQGAFQYLKHTLVAECKYVPMLSCPSIGVFHAVIFVQPRDSRDYCTPIRGPMRDHVRGSQVPIIVLRPQFVEFRFWLKDVERRACRWLGGSLLSQGGMG